MTSQREFDFVAGSTALSFVDTLGDRGGDGRERLQSPAALVRWLRAAGLAAEGLAEPTAEQLADARSLREAIYRTGLHGMSGQALDPNDLAILNAAALRPPLRPQWRGDALVTKAERPLEAALSTLAGEALTLFASPLARRIRICPGCAMMFVDQSRPGRRRWCSSASGCGNRAKVERHRAKQVKIMHRTGKGRTA